MSNTEDSLVPYQEMVERALRSVLRDALARVEEQGLPGNHHYYISFLTRHDGVTIPGSPPRALPRRDDHRPAAPVLGARGGR